jgi:hypothetical protein
MSLQSLASFAELKKQVAHLGDEALVEEIMFFHDGAEFSDEVQDIIAHFMNKGKLTKAERICLENTYCLFWSENTEEE